MLPGFRFLVAAIVFSFSVIVFGLGAAALFRAAHEQFASSSSWRATPETSFTTFLPQVEPPRPMIAMLRVEPAVPLPVSASPAAADMPTELSPTDAPAAAAALPPALPAPSEQTTRADIVDTERPTAEATEAAPPMAAPEIAETPTPASLQPDEANMPPANMPAADIASADAAPATTGIAVAQPDSSPAITAVQTTIQAPIGTDTVAVATAPPATPAVMDPAARPDPIASKLAALGEQPTASQRSASLKTASLQLRRSLARKRLAKERLARERIAEARRARRHRQMAQQAHAARNAAAALQQQQYANPFAQPQGFGQSAFGQQTR